MHTTLVSDGSYNMSPHDTKFIIFYMMHKV